MVQKRLKIKSIIKMNIVAIVAIIAAIITSFIIRPDTAYKNYFDFYTLTCLLCMSVIISAYKNIYFFQITARKIVSLFKTTRSAIIALVYITFIGSMVIANDMALITFLPLGFYVLTSTGKQKYMAFTFIMQNIAANLGGMLTPFGNPQNLYIYSIFNIPSLEFMAIMFWPFILSITLITICCLFVKKDELILTEEFDKTLDFKKAIYYSLLFIFFMVIIFRLVPYQYGLLIIPLILIFDFKAYKGVDYPLLLTFTAFFIFSGNIARIEVVSKVLTSLLDFNTLLTGVISCQFISNVPSAILLAPFTENYKELLVAVNIGGTGTLIASLASLITFREYVKNNPNKQFYYIKMYSLYNFGFLIVLTLFALFILF